MNARESKLSLMCSHVDSKGKLDVSEGGVYKGLQQRL